MDMPAHRAAPRKRVWGLTPWEMWAQVSAFPLSAMFGMCAFFLFVCVLCQKRLESLVHPEKDYQLVEGESASPSQPGSKAAFLANV